MSTAVKEKKPFLPTRKPPAQSGGSVVRSGTASALRPAAGFASLALGGEPRVHLLPLEVSERKKLRALKRRLFTAVIAAIVIAAGAYGAVVFALSNAQTDLSNAQSETAALVTQQGQYGQVTKVKADIAAIQAGQKTATAQEILWAPYVSQLEGTLPAGATITRVSASIDTPFSSALTPAAAPLEGPHLATIALSLTMVEGTIPAWLDTLPTTKGYVDNSLDSVTSAGPGVDTVAITIHVDEKALSNRFTSVGGTTK